MGEIRSDVLRQAVASLFAGALLNGG